MGDGNADTGSDYLDGTTTPYSGDKIEINGNDYVIFHAGGSTCYIPYTGPHTAKTPMSSSCVSLAAR